MWAGVLRMLCFIYYPATSAVHTSRPFHLAPGAGQRNLLPIVRIFHLSRWIQFTEQLIIPQYLLADSGLVAGPETPPSDKKVSCSNLIKRYVTIFLQILYLPRWITTVEPGKFARFIRIFACYFLFTTTVLNLESAVYMYLQLYILFLA